MTTQLKQLKVPATVLRVAIGLTATLAGLDKFFNILTDWTAYVSPLVTQVLPLSASTLMQIVGVVEIGVGACILFVAPVVGSYVASAWLLLVAVNLVTAGFLDVAVRDVVMSIAAFTLARLLTLDNTIAAQPRVAAAGHGLI